MDTFRAGKAADRRHRWTSWLGGLLRPGPRPASKTLSFTEIAFQATVTERFSDVMGAPRRRR
jgi:hypothetical protein